MEDWQKKIKDRETLNIAEQEAAYDLELVLEGIEQQGCDYDRPSTEAKAIMLLKAIKQGFVRGVNYEEL